LGANIGRKFRRPLNVLQHELQLLHCGFRIVAHRAAGVDDRVFNFAA
jgi:hypothetical protein